MIWTELVPVDLPLGRDFGRHMVSTLADQIVHDVALMQLRLMVELNCRICPVRIHSLQRWLIKLVLNLIAINIVSARSVLFTQNDAIALLWVFLG